MSAIVAFWTFRILPRIGSRAWNSEDRASLAVPRALSPSTMNSSLRSTSLVRQSASFEGSDEVSRAFFRREISFCLRALSRARISATTLSSRIVACVFWSRVVAFRSFASSVSTTLPSACGVPPTPSLPCASSLSRMSGSRTIVFSAAFNLSTIAFGVFAGTNMAYQESTSKSGTPASCMVGTSGNCDQRVAGLTASAVSSPARTCWAEAGALSMANSTSPASTASMLGAVPR